MNAWIVERETAASGEEEMFQNRWVFSLLHALWQTGLLFALAILFVFFGICIGVKLERDRWQEEAYEQHLIELTPAGYEWKNR